MTIHLIEGEAGCSFAREENCVAVIVDALRASATAAMLFDSGAREIVAVSEVEDALRAREHFPDALLCGERGGLPPEGFDFGNSPRQLGKVEGRVVIFTTTTGTTRVNQAFGAQAVYMGSTVNARAAMAAASDKGRDIVLIPAGRAGDPDFNAQEDWVAAVAMAMVLDEPIGEGGSWYREWRHLIELDGVAKLFETAPHAENLRGIGYGEDIAFCARMNLTAAVPEAIEQTDIGVRLVSAHSRAAFDKAGGIS